MQTELTTKHTKSNPCGFCPINMKENQVYKLIELTGTSSKSIEDAVNSALNRAGQTIKNLRWFQIVETRGEIGENAVKHWQVTLKVGFAVE
jgi:flavin-binding protein dodecin